MTTRFQRISTLPLLIGTLFFFNGCTKTGESKEVVPQPAGKALDNVSEVRSVQFPDTLVPQFSWIDEKGKSISFSEFSKGNVVLINFWAAWCGPCKRELPDLVELNNEYASRNAKVLGISVDRGEDVLQMVHKFAQANNLHYPIIIDNGELEKAFGGIRGIPTTFFIDKNGKIAQRMIGLQSKAVFASALDALLK